MPRKTNLQCNLRKSIIRILKGKCKGVSLSDFLKSVDDTRLERIMRIKKYRIKRRCRCV